MMMSGNISGHARSMYQASGSFDYILLAIVFGAVVLYILYTPLKRTGNRRLRLAVPAIVLIAGYLPFSGMTLPVMLTYAPFLVIAPMAVLLVHAALPRFIDPELGFQPVLIAYAAVSVFSIVLLLVYGSLRMGAIVQNSPLPAPGAITYAVFALFEILFAVAVSWMMSLYHSPIPDPDRKME